MQVEERRRAHPREALRHIRVNDVSLQASGRYPNKIDYHVHGACGSERGMDVLTGENCDPLQLLALRVRHRPEVDHRFRSVRDGFMMDVGFFLRERLLQDGYRWPGVSTDLKQWLHGTLPSVRGASSDVSGAPQGSGNSVMTMGYQPPFAHWSAGRLCPSRPRPDRLTLCQQKSEKRSVL